MYDLGNINLHTIAWDSILSTNWVCLCGKVKSLHCFVNEVIWLLLSKLHLYLPWVFSLRLIMYSWSWIFWTCFSAQLSFSWIWISGAQNLFWSFYSHGLAGIATLFAQSLRGQAQNAFVMWVTAMPKCTIEKCLWLTNINSVCILLQFWILPQCQFNSFCEFYFETTQLYTTKIKSRSARYCIWLVTSSPSLLPVK